MSEPLSDEELAAIRERVEKTRGKTMLSIASPPLDLEQALSRINQPRRDQEALLAEVDRLRTERVEANVLTNLRMLPVEARVGEAEDAIEAQGKQIEALAQQVKDAVTENERLRAENDKLREIDTERHSQVRDRNVQNGMLRAQVAAMRPIVARSYADIIKHGPQGACDCWTCEGARELMTEEQARALLAKEGEDASPE